MIFPEMYLQCIVIDVVLLLLPSSIAAIANVAAFVFVSAVCVELVVSVEALSAKPTFRMPLEAALIDCSWVVVPKFLVLPELGVGE